MGVAGAIATSLRWQMSISSLSCQAKKRVSIFGSQKTEVGPFSDVGENGYTVKCNTSDVQLQRNANEAGHGVVEENFRR